MERSSNNPAPAAPYSLSPGWRILLSIVLGLHVLAVFTGPWAMGPQGSGLARTISGWMGPYIQGTFLNNGYRFFGPEPGPGHLVRYEIVTRDGRQIDGFFPDKINHQPRLLYHRHFMLSEFLNSIGNPEEDPSELATAYEQSYAKHLANKYDAKNVKLYLRRHRLAAPDDIKKGKRLDDPQFYDEKLIVEFEDDGAST